MSRELLGPEKLVIKRQSACFEKLIFLHVFNIRKTKRIAKFEGLEPRLCEDIKAVVAPEIGPKSFGTFEKHAPGLQILLKAFHSFPMVWVRKIRSSHFSNIHKAPFIYGDLSFPVFSWLHCLIKWIRC